MTSPDPGDPLGGWDRLSDIDVDSIEPTTVPSFSQEAAPTVTMPWSARLAAAWADLVVVAGLTTSMVAAVIVSGYPLNIHALPWAAVVAFVGWAAACGILLRVRRGTPGMLLAGFVFADEISGSRLGWTIAVAGLSAVLLGLPAIPGSRSASLLSIASGSTIDPTS